MIRLEVNQEAARDWFQHRQSGYKTNPWHKRVGPENRSCTCESCRYSRHLQRGDEQ